MSRLGVVVALGVEARALTGRRLQAGAVAALADGGLVAVAGVGPERARRAAGELLERRANALMSWGCAAALSEGLPAGRLLLPQTLVAPEAAAVEVTQGWHALLARELAGSMPFSTGALAHTPQVLTTPADKRALAARCGAVAADMESFAVGARARAAGVPFVAVRAVADTAAMAVPDWIPQAIDGAGGIAVPRLVRSLLAHGGDARVLIALAWGFRRARATLAQVAPRATGSALAQGQPIPRRLVS